MQAKKKPITRPPAARDTLLTDFKYLKNCRVSSGIFSLTKLIHLDFKKSKVGFVSEYILEDTQFKMPNFTEEVQMFIVML